MKLTRWLMIAALGLVSASAGWAQDYNLTFTNWDDGQTFNFIPFSNSDPNAAFGQYGLNTADFQNNICPGFAFCSDPGVKFNGGGDAQGESGQFDFETGVLDEDDNNALLVNGNQVPNGVFENDGSPINEVLIFLTSNGGQINPDQVGDEFSCSSDIFANCGFFDDGLVIAFYNPIGGGVGIPSAVPEPSQWMFLLLGCAAVVVLRARKGSTSLFFARTQK